MCSKRIMQKATEIYLILFASVHLLFFGFSGYSRIFEAKITTFCAINGLYFACAVFVFFKAVFAEHVNIGNFIKRKLNYTYLFVLLYLIFTIVSGLFSQHFPKTFFGMSRFEGMFSISFYCISFILVSLFPCRKKVVLTVFAISSTLFASLCVLQTFGFNSFNLYPAGTNFYDAGRLYTTAFISTIGNTNLSGAFICLALPLFTTLIIKSKSKLRFLLLIPTLLLAYTVFKMDVTSCLLGIFAGFILTIPFILGFSKKATVIYFAVLIVIFILCLTVIYFAAPEKGFIHEISRILHGDISESFGSGRIRIWKNVLSQIGDSPIFGKGPDTMISERFAPFERYYPDRGKVMKTGIDIAHNEFLNVLYHQGILGLFAYMGFIACVLGKWLKNRRDTAILALGVSLICYLIQSFFTFSMCLVAPYFWICSGLVVGMENCAIEEPTLG